MIRKTSQHLTATEVLCLIEEARKAEMCRDIKSLHIILRPVWQESENLPDFAEYEPTIRAELFRLCGFYLTFSGRAQNLKNHHIQGKDLLTRAVEIFDSEGLIDKSAEAKTILAFCYWNRGEISECDALLSLVENDFHQDKTHPVYLQAKINRLLIFYWENKFDDAIPLINEISGAMELCKDIRLRAMFHSECGIIFRWKNRYEESVYHFQKALKLSAESQNLRFVAVNFNNISLLYRDIKQFQLSHSFADKALQLYSELGDTGWIPHVLDTKALIFIDENKYDEALKTIEEALKYFYKGEDSSGLIHALWTKVRCLLRLNQNEEAFAKFGELQHIARENIGEVAALKFAKYLAEEVYTLRHFPLTEEIAEFKKSQVAKALQKANGKIAQAAQILGLKNHQALSEILRKQFPELYQELGFQRRAKRGSKAQTTKEREQNVELGEREIARLEFSDKTFTFDFPFSNEKFETFYLDKFLMQSFGIESGAIVAVIEVTKWRKGMNVLVMHDDTFTISKVEYDNWADIYYVWDEQEQPVPLEEANVIGSPVGYCLISEADKNLIKFYRLD